MRLEKLFLIIFLMFGLTLVFMVPPGWNTDEPDHTYRIYQLSKGDLLSERVLSPSGLKAYGGEVAAGLVDLYADAGVRDAGASAADKNIKVGDLYKTHPNIKKYNDDGRKRVINFSGAALYSPLSYAIYLPVFSIGDLLKLPFFTIIIISRVIGLFAVGIAFYFSIKYIKFGKWILFVIGLLPVSIVQAASVGADGPLLAVAILFLAYLVNVVATNRGPTTKNYVILTLLGVLLTVIKLAYAPLTLLILIVPLLKRNTLKKDWAITITAVLVAVTPGVIWTMLVSYIDTNSNLQANFSLQRSFIIHEPLLYLKTLYYTFFTNEQTPLEGLFGNAIWNSVPLPAFFTYLAAGIVALSTCIKSSREVATKIVGKLLIYWRLSLILVFTITALLIATILYIYSSTLRQSSIIGLQARYFLPLLPVLLVALYGNFLRNQIVAKRFVVCVVVIILTGAVFAIYHRLYQMLPILL